MVLQPGKIFEFILGQTAAPKEMTSASVASKLHDPFAQLVLGLGLLPLTLSDLLKIVDSVGGSDALPERHSFVVADGGQIPWTPQTSDLDRSIRFAITRGVKDQPVALMVSTGSVFDSAEIFLQVIGWDPKAGAFQFYDRRDGSWIWAGSSWNSLEPETRGNGPFDSHVNGALNMKELKLPWINWHSMEATIDAAIDPNDPLRNEPLWINRSGGEDFETKVARPGVVQWTNSRIAACTKNARLTRLPDFFRQVLDTSTVNLRTSAVPMSQVVAGKPVPIPLTFFINSDELVDGIGLDPGVQALPQVDGAIYLDMLQRFDVSLTDGNLRFKGDTHFVFLYPEPAFEDVLIVDKLREIRVLSDKLAASLLMVDFCNPVFSKRRRALLAYVPTEASIPPTAEASSDFENTFVDAVRAAAAGTPVDSPEREFLTNWSLPADAWQAEFNERLRSFFAAVSSQLTNANAFAEMFQLAESRRREFRKRPLAEFRLTTPVTNIPDAAPFLEFTTGGAVQAKR